MRISLDNLPEGRASWSFTAQDAWAKQAADAALEASTTALEGGLAIQVEDARVLVSGQVRVQVPGSCERCGEALERVLSASFELTYVKEPVIEAHELELEADDLDVGYHDGSLDLTSVLSEAIALEIPARTVCDDVAACDQRTTTLLTNHGRAGDEHANPFSSLTGLNLH